MQLANTNAVVGGGAHEPVYDEEELDEFGNAKHTSPFGVAAGSPHGAHEHCDGQVTAEVVVPWHARTVVERDCTHALGIVNSAHFWNKTEFTARATLIAFLPCCCLVAAARTQGFFVSQTFVCLGALIGGSPNLGAALYAFFQFAKGACFWLPFCTAMIAGRLWEHDAAWNCVYTFGCLAICALSTSFTMRFCLIFFNICLMSQRSSAIGQSITFPSHALLEVVIGFGFGLLSVLVPYPKLASTTVDGALLASAQGLASCIPLVHRAFWAPNSTERNIVARKLAMVLRKMDHHFSQVPTLVGMSYYEMFLLGVQRQLLRKAKVDLFLKLQYRAACMARVLEFMREMQVLMTQHTEEHSRGSAKLMDALDCLTGDIGQAMTGVARAQTRDEAVRAIRVETLRQHTDTVRELILQIRMELFHNVDYRITERKSSIVSFYIFAVLQFAQVLEEISATLVDDSKWASSLQAVLFFFVSTAIEQWNTLKAYLSPGEREWHRVCEAIKTSGSMIASVRFFIFMNASTAFLSGPAVIAFCAGDTFGETINGAFMRVFGVMFGCVLGYFADSYSDTPYKKVASICTIFFCASWFRDSKKFGNAAFYAAFNTLSMIALRGKFPATFLTIKIQQNSFAILFYVLVAMLFWPRKPVQMLREARSKTIHAVSTTFQLVLGLFRVNFSDRVTFFDRMSAIKRSHANAQGCLAAEAALLSTVEDEPIFTPLPYPSALNRDTHMLERKLVFTLDMCIGAWSMLYDESQRETLQRLMLSFAPVADDLIIALRATTNVVRELELNPFVTLTQDLITEGYRCISLGTNLSQRMQSGHTNAVVASQAKVAMGKVGGGLRLRSASKSEALSTTGAASPSEDARDIALSPADTGLEGRILSADSGSGDGSVTDTAPLLVSCRVEDVSGLHTIRHSIVTFIETFRFLAVAVNDMHYFDEETNWKFFF